MRQSDTAIYDSLEGDDCTAMEELHLDHTSEQWIYLMSIWRQYYSTMDISFLVHAVHMQETYENIQDLLKKIHYEDHQYMLT
jgi:hypothetical protein